MLPHLSLIARYTRLVYVHTHYTTRAIRFFLRSLLRWRSTTDWLTYIEKHSFLSEAPDNVRRVLADKIHKPFARCHIGVARRVTMLTTHYDILKTLWKPELLKKLVAGDRLVLAALHGQHDAEDYNITLCREMLSQHQGELAFLMIDPHLGIPLSRLVINLARDEAGAPRVILNGIQGPGAEFKNRIVRVTRNLDGLRPKRAIMEVACAFARAIGAKSILAISKKNHVSQTLEKWQLRNRTDYDSFWEEFSSAREANGDYLIPLTIERRAPEDVPGKKRKAAISRYALVDKLANDIEESVRQNLAQ